ncbi:cytochrome c oxidase assembly protein [Sphaerisporangium fuscum]|uniref:cytochrome c oxidase assembly protein n=1 Tax=Sphaerisporangium fuscum TaxID=2835868 RepID=UPI001BDD48E3|nr:cytochrome c oxidase assembly protein [Sphaerisporangium fuscum]
MTSPRRRPAMFVLIVVAAFAVLLLAMWFGGAWPREEIPGLPSPGTLTTLGLPVARVAHDICAVATIGLLLSAVFLTGDEASRQKIMRVAGRWSLAWAGTAVLTEIFTLSDLLGLPVGEALTSGFLPTFAMEVPQGQAFVVVIMLTLLIALAATTRLGGRGRALLFALALFAVLPPAYVGHSASAADHTLAISSLMAHIAGVAMWGGGLFGLVTMLRKSERLVFAVRRFSALALCCFVAVGFSGAVNAWIRLGDPVQLWQSRYGLLVLAKLAALVALGWFGWRHRRVTIRTLENASGPAAGEPPASGPSSRVATSASSRPFLRLALAETGVMACTVALAVALSRTPPPRDTPHAQHELLGYALPGLTPGRLFTEIRPDPIVILAVAGMAVAYLVGARRLSRSATTAQGGPGWSRGRLVAALAGLLCLLYGLAGGVAAYAPAVFSMHAVQYALLGTVGPALLALGVPLGPLREAAPIFRRPLSGDLATRMSHPLTALIVYAVPYFLLYVTNLFEQAQSSLAVRLIAQAVVVVTGVWFFVVTLGADRLPRTITPVVRARMLAGALAVQAWIALVFLAGPLQGVDWYEALAIPWVTDRAADQRTGALLGPGPAAVMILVLLTVVVMRRRDARGEPASEKLSTGTPASRK